MTYWKFLRAGMASPFTGHVWVPGQWEHARTAQACASGFHACRIRDLPYWLNDELWLIEFASAVSAERHKVVATQARLVARVDQWGPAAARELGLACILRTVKHAEDELRDRGLGEEAGLLVAESGQYARELLAASEPAGQAAKRAGTAWADLARECADKASAQRARQASKLCMYVSDSVEWLDAAPLASLAHVAAHAADQRSTADAADPYEAEREWQAGWLASRLGLTDDNA